MSDIEMRRGLRSLMASPQQLSDEELDKLFDVLCVERVQRCRSGGRNPLLFPKPGDIVQVPTGHHRRSPVARRVVACEEFAKMAKAIDDGCGPEIPWSIAAQANYCQDGNCAGRVHWERHAGKGARIGSVLKQSWAAWARGGTVLQAGAL